MSRTIAVVFLLLLSTAAAQTAVESGVIMGNTGRTSVGTSILRRMDEAGATTNNARSATHGSSPSAANAPVNPKMVTLNSSRRHSPRGTVTRGHSKQGITTPGPMPDAEITAESSPVYRGAAAQGTPVAMLKKGDKVAIDFEFKSSKESWCSVKRGRDSDPMGYMRCADLRRAPAGK